MSLLASVVNCVMLDAAESADFAGRDGLFALVFELVHFLLGGVVLLEEEPEDHCCEKGRDGEAGWMQVSRIRGERARKVSTYCTSIGASGLWRWGPRQSRERIRTRFGGGTWP